MKMRVIGWTTYDYYDFEEGEQGGWAVHNAVVAELKKQGYFFAGLNHQESANCAPVMNDGKMRRFSQRGFADMMAEACGDDGYKAYARYMFSVPANKCVMPASGLDPNDVVAETDLNETFTKQVDQQFFDNAPVTAQRQIWDNYAVTEVTVTFADLEEFASIDEGDTLVLTCNGQSKTFDITRVERKMDIDDDKRFALERRLSAWDNKDKEDRKLAEKEYLAVPIILVLHVKQK